MKPMLFGSRTVEELPDMAADERVAIEQKCDGVRVLAELGPGTAKFTGAGGEPVRFTAATQWFDLLSRKLALPDPDFAVVLDGELMIENGQYVVFDLPYLRFGKSVMITPEREFCDRRAVLQEIRAAFRPALRLVRHAVSPADKIALVEHIERIGGEGFMLKRLDAPYQPGHRVEHSVKCKFVHTADCVVMSWTRGTGTGSAELGVYHGSELIRVGACSLIGKPEVEDGCVVEVAYGHYRDAMVQPRMLRRREDKLALACTMTQFQPYSKEVV